MTTTTKRSGGYAPIYDTPALQDLAEAFGRRCGSWYRERGGICIYLIPVGRPLRGRPLSNKVVVRYACPGSAVARRIEAEWGADAMVGCYTPEARIDWMLEDAFALAEELGVTL